MDHRYFISIEVTALTVFVCFLTTFSYGQLNEFKENLNRIVGGRDAFIGEFPHHVSLQISSRHICSGAIIERKWILTAAHCVLVDNLTVLAGKYNIELSEDTEQISQVENTFIHELYSGSLKPYDIAMLKLSSPFRFNEYVNAIDLPAMGREPHGNAVLSGWGSISRTKEQVLPTNLQSATMPIIDIDLCRQMFTTVSPNSFFELDETNLCTGPGRHRLSSCAGDSGGPLIANGELIGVTSWGVTPCEGQSPTTYGKVSYFIDWIETIIYFN